MTFQPTANYLNRCRPPWPLISFGSFNLFLAGLVSAEIKFTVHVALPKWPVKLHKQVQYSRKQSLRTYCPNIYTVFLAAYSPRKFQPLGDVLEIGQKTASVGKWPTLDQ